MIRAVIVEDEDLARQHMARLLGAHPDIEIAGEASNGVDAVELISEVQHILSEFRRLRPPPTFAKRRLLRLVKAEEFCAICSGRVDRSMGNFTASEYAVYRTSCLDGPD